MILLIMYSNDAFIITPYGSSYSITARRTTASGSAGAPDSYLTVVATTAVQTQGRWYLRQYTGEERSVATIYYSETWRDKGIQLNWPYTVSAEINYTTRINAHDHSITTKPGDGYLVNASWDTTTKQWSVTAINPGELNIYVQFLSSSTGLQVTWVEFDFRIIPDEATYSIQNVGTSRYIDIEGPSKSAGAKIHQWDFHTGSYERWTVEHVEDSDGYIRLKSPYSNLYMGVDSSDTSLIKQYATQNNYTLWTIDRSVAGNLIFICKATQANNKVLSVPLDANINGTDLTQLAYTDDTNYRDEWSYERLLPTNGSEIAYNPGAWNTYVEFCCNCYAYAINNQVLPGTNILWFMQQMGQYKGEEYVIPYDTIFTADNVYQAVMYDFGQYNADYDESLFFQSIGRYEPCPEGSYKVALVAGITPEGDPDYHWYRQDADGLWSHKPGNTSVKREDESQNPIFDPYTADWGMYTEFLGYYAVTPWNNMFLDTGGEAYCYWQGEIWVLSRGD